MTCIDCHKGIAHQLPAGMETMQVPGLGAQLDLDDETLAEVRKYIAESEKKNRK